MSWNGTMLAAALLIAPGLLAQTPTLDQIVSNVVAHQDQADKLRAKYAYTQQFRVRALRGNGKFSREEYCVYNVAPTEEATQKKLVQFQGRYQDKGRIVEYSKPGQDNPDRKMDIDAVIMPSLSATV